MTNPLADAAELHKMARAGAAAAVDFADQCGSAWSRRTTWSRRARGAARSDPRGAPAGRWPGRARPLVGLRPEPHLSDPRMILLAMAAVVIAGWYFGDLMGELLTLALVVQLVIELI
jgi:hypothetical protein